MESFAILSLTLKALMTKKIINTSKAPDPIGPYNQAIQSGNMLFISGQVALKPGTSEMANADIIEETHQVMKNLKSILSEAGMDFNAVVKTTIFLSDMELFGQVNEIYGKYFDADFPARETVAVKGLPKNANVEISMIAISKNIN
ncbi:MAG: RidA family protein [Chitinophagaceae bacterium]|nr:RidA family protein [Chitinophagaceae bacterium]